MSIGLDLQSLPRYCYSAFKYFQPGERHVTRRCAEDVLILMLEGTLYFTEDGDAIEVHRGEYYIQRRGLMQESAVPSTGAVYYYIHFLGEYCENQDALPLRGALRLTEERERMERLDLLQSTGGTAVETGAEFLSILAELRRGIGMTEHKKIVHSIIARVTEDIRRPWTLAELSALSGYSVNHVIHIFRTETGQTPHAFITGLRLHTARMLLLDSDMPLSRIAEECGFGGYVNFYKTFLNRHGCTPQQWRQRGRKEEEKGNV